VAASVAVGVVDEGCCGSDDDDGNGVKNFGMVLMLLSDRYLASVVF